MRIFFLTFIFIMSSCWSVQAKKLDTFWIETDQRQHITERGYTILQSHNMFNLYLVKAATKDELMNIEGVKSVTKESTVKMEPIVPQYTSISMKGILSDWGFQSLHLDHLLYGNKKVGIALIDTGVDYTNPALAPYLEPGVSTISTSTQDDQGHGTKVASIITNDSPLNVRIIPYKVLDYKGQGMISDILDGIEAAIQNPEVSIMNMSLGSISELPAVEASLKVAHDRGIHLLASSGNFGGEGLSYPAKYDSVIAVGATTKTYQLASFSQRGEGISFVAPGELVSVYNLEHNLVQDSGTSLAVAYVTKMLSATLTNQSLSPMQAFETLRSSATHPNTYSNNDGYGLLQTDKLNYMNIYETIDLSSMDIVSSKVTTNPLKSWVITLNQPLLRAPEAREVFLVNNKQQLLPFTIKYSKNKVIVVPQKAYETDVDYMLVMVNATSAYKKHLKKGIIMHFRYEKKY